MKSFKLVILSGFLIGTLGTTFAVTAQPAQAAINSDCKVTVIGTENTANKNNSKFTMKGDKVTAKFKVTGKNCREGVTLAAWESPNAQARPLSAQRLYKYTQGTFAEGTHSLTVQVPTTKEGKVAGCYFQVDLVRGLKPTGKDGGPAYGPERNMGWLLGGTKKCETKPPVNPPVTPPVVPPAIPPTTPEEPPVTPETPKVTPDEKEKDVPEALPVTGPGAIISTVMGVSTLSGAVHYFIRRRFF